ncbi:MAG: hypothetical protein KDK70_02355 [Myxococcales bacterium]|nr:hypothetical protein [Myxococcales bacterium]
MNPARRPKVPARGWLPPLALLTASLACRPSGPATEPTAEPPGGATQAPAPPVSPVIDPARMKADLEYLSSDALRGRFTLSDDLGVAADFIAAQYEAMGIAPVGSSYRVPFEVPAGFEPGDALTMWIESADEGSRGIGPVRTRRLGPIAMMEDFRSNISPTPTFGVRCSALTRNPPIEKNLGPWLTAARAVTEGTATTTGEAPRP